MGFDKWSRRGLVLMLPLFLWAVPLVAQEMEYSEEQAEYMQEEIEHKPFDKKVWEDETKGLDYTEEIEEEPEEEEVEEEKEQSDFDLQPPSFDLSWLKYLLYIMAIAIPAAIVLYLLAPQLFAHNPKVTQKAEFTLENLDENLPKSELERLLDAALAKKDYRLAVRIQFLMVIKTLNDRGLITWKKDKTNYEYLREVETKPIYNGLFEITLLFERVWYGDRELQQEDYNPVSNRFSQFLNELKGGKSA